MSLSILASFRPHPDRRTHSASRAIPFLGTLLAALLSAGALGQATNQAPATTPPAAPPAVAPGEPAQALQEAPPTRAERDRHSILLRTPKPGPAGFVGDPYPLDVCIVSGDKLGPDAVSLVLKDMPDALQEGRHLTFCGPSCQEQFLKNANPYLAKLDAAIIERFAAEYPLDICMVLLDEKIDAEAKTLVYGNRVYKVCCKRCVTNFSNQSARYTKAYEKFVIVKQRPKYPLDTCVVTGEKLGAHPIDVVIGSHLVRVAHEAAHKTLLEHPAVYLEKLAAARSAAAPKS